LGVQLKNTFFNTKLMEAKNYPLETGDTMYFGSTFVTIKEIVNSSNSTSTAGASPSSGEGGFNVDLSDDSNSGGFFGSGSGGRGGEFGGFGGRRR
jgi:hypothetical protein